MHGLYLTWWVQERHIPAATVAAILAAGDLAITLFEVPTGWLADRAGHRLSLILGSSLQIAGMLCCWLGQSIPALLTASILVALGDAFRSGADQALLYRSCVAVDREHDFLRIESRAKAVGLGALVALTIAGGVIVKAWGFAAGWIAETALSAAGLALAVAMVEPPPIAALDEEPNVRAGRSTLRAAMLAALILPASVLGAGEGIASFVLQTSGDYSPDLLTVIVGAVTLAEAGGAAFAPRVRLTGTVAQVSAATLGLATLAIGLLFGAVRPEAILVLSFLLGVAHPLRAVAIQRLAGDTDRARAASIASMCDKLLSAVTLPLAGFNRRGRP